MNNTEVGEDRGGRVGRGVVKSQVAKLVDVVLASLVTILVSRWLGPDDFGRFSLILGWVSFAGLAISLGFSEVLTRFVPVLADDGRSIRRFLLNLLAIRTALALALGMLIWVTAPVVFVWLKRPELVSSVDWIVLLFWLSQAADLFWSFFMARLRVEVVFASHTLRQSVIIGVVLILSPAGVPSLQPVLIAMCAAYGLSLAVYGLAFAHGREPSGSDGLRINLRPALRFGLSVWLVAALTFLLSEQSDVLLLGTLVQDSSAVGYYKVGTALVWKLIGVITAGSPVVLTSLSILNTQSGMAGLMRGWQTFIKLSTMTVVPLYALAGWFAPQIVSTLYGSEYLPSVDVLRLFVVLTVVPFGLLGGGVHLMALYTLGRERAGLMLRVVSGMVNLALGILLIRAFGAIGAVAATGLSAILGIGLEYVMLQRYRPMPYPWAFCLKTTGAVLVGLAAVLVLPSSTWLEWLIAGLAYVGVIAALLRWWKPLTEEDCEMISRISPRLRPMAALFRPAAQA
ncbi:MAG TPA: oligosaccharide flippase family protein [Anaerolineae bacterium]|nr:oligosaccharide flippase family protein [Anaerolineae bacterium]